MDHPFRQRPFRSVSMVAALIFIVTAGCTPEGPAPESPPAEVATTGGPVFESEEYPVRVVTVAEGLLNPYCLAFLPDGSMLVTEQDGQFRLIRDGVLTPEPVGSVSVQAGTGGGLMDLALHPNFSENNRVYFTFTKAVPGGVTTAVGRGVFDGTEMTDISDVFVADALSTTRGHLSARLAFAGDGTLFVATSDANVPERAQDMGDHSGKVLRLNDDGTAPDDNPFIGRPGHRPEIFTAGHRNQHAVVVHPETGDVWVNEHGDEVNILEAGANYGWPFLSVGGEGGGNPTMSAPRDLDLKWPFISWNPTLNISGLVFYNGDQFPEWRGDLFVGGLSTQQVHRVSFGEIRPDVDTPLFTQFREAVVTGVGRVRDLRQGPDGFIYLVINAATDGRFSAGGAAGGSIVRIEPAG